jgi:hypothetical protein
MRFLEKITLVFFFCITTMLNAQMSKPSIMFIPSKFWMFEKGYTQKINNQGSEEVILDYQKALTVDKDLTSVLNMLSSEFSKYGLPCISLEMSYNQYQQELGSGNLPEFPTADLRIEFNWKIEVQGPKKRISNFSLTAFDSYTNKMIGMIDISGDWASSQFSNTDMLRESLLSKSDALISNIMAFTEDVYKNGQEISLNIVTIGNFEGDLESKYNGVSISTIIEDWISKNSVNGLYTIQNQTSTRIIFREIRRPVFDENQKQMNNHIWLTKLVKELKEKYNIPCKIESTSKYKSSIIIG